MMMSQRGPPGSGRRYPGGKAGKVLLRVTVRADVRNELMMISATRNCSAPDLIREGIVDLLEKLSTGVKPVLTPSPRLHNPYNQQIEVGADKRRHLERIAAAFQCELAPLLREAIDDVIRKYTHTPKQD